VALLPGIALSPGSIVWYGRCENRDLASVAFPRTSSCWVYPSGLLSRLSSRGSVTANPSLHLTATPPWLLSSSTPPPSARLGLAAHRHTLPRFRSEFLRGTYSPQRPPMSFCPDARPTWSRFLYPRVVVRSQVTYAYGITAPSGGSVPVFVQRVWYIWFRTVRVACISW